MEPERRSSGSEAKPPASMRRLAEVSTIISVCACAGILPSSALMRVDQIVDVEGREGRLEGLRDMAGVDAFGVALLDREASRPSC